MICARFMKFFLAQSALWTIVPIDEALARSVRGPPADVMKPQARSFARPLEMYCLGARAKQNAWLEAALRSAPAVSMFSARQTTDSFHFASDALCGLQATRH